MISFLNDYSEGAHERVLKALCDSNRLQTVGYGEDEFCEEAKKLIAQNFLKETTKIHFLVGGTQVNTTVIAAVLKPWQGVIAADTGHISVHETGAIESTGHKVLTLPAKDGKISAEQIDSLIREHYADDSMEHMVQPGMVYISQPTELGTLYSRAELEAIHTICQKFQIPLYIDGARLASALTCEENDVTLGDLEMLADMFTIGGTKMGCLFGEALVMCSPRYNVCFRYMIKQRGGLLAKGRLLGIQFAELFRDDLYFQIGSHCNKMAHKLKKGFLDLGYPMGVDSSTNQIFPILPIEVMDQLAENYRFTHWSSVDATHMMLRFVTSWATEESNVDQFLSDLAALTK